MTKRVRYILTPSRKWMIVEKIRAYRDRHPNFNISCVKIGLQYRAIKNFFWGLGSCVFTSYKYMFAKNVAIEDKIKQQQSRSQTAQGLVRYLIKPVSKAQGTVEIMNHDDPQLQFLPKENKDDHEPI